MPLEKVENEQVPKDMYEKLFDSDELKVWQRNDCRCVSILQYKTEGL